MADVSVRPAGPADAERVARVQLSTWRTAYADLLPPQALDVPEVQAAALWLGAIESPPTTRHRLLVAFERDELVGFAATGPASDDGLDPETAGELLTVLVEPRWGRRGHGARLLAAAVAGWRETGATTAITWVLEGDLVSTSFLRSAGWEADGAARGLDTGLDVRRQIRLHTDLREG